MRKPIHEFIKLALDGGYVFHGSPTSFDVLEPYQTQRRTNGVVVYDAVSAHATPLLCCALNYLAAPFDYNNGYENGYNNGVSLKEVPVREIEVFGPKTRKDAMNHLFGRGGYMYAFKSNDFRHVRGLGMSEVISLTSVVPIYKVRLSYADILEMARFIGISFVFEGVFTAD